MNISVLGIDIAKNIFQLHGVDNSGRRVLNQRRESTHMLLTNTIQLTYYRVANSCIDFNT
ncbi:hypothetical protein OQJ26_16955 [Legionella sp. PATHC038]|uniref:hypothetical protein n=1 Tax=Legionella sheltonii TaxID=2992041 RepID=UPI0022434F5C|nr:hypothetical protein [Legionella sp. PATHC038]MCW8400471.1 hypothetical protein [Legionella sp. PATHC038]